MDKYELVPDQQMKGRQVLSCNGVPKLCPYIPPMAIPVQNNSGLQIKGQQAVQIVYRECGEWCSLFRVKKSDTGTTVFTTCAQTPVGIDIDTEKGPQLSKVL